MYHFLYRWIIMKPRLIFYEDNRYLKLRHSRLRKIDNIFFVILQHIHILVYLPFSLIKDLTKALK